MALVLALLSGVASCGAGEPAPDPSGPVGGGGPGGTPESGMMAPRRYYVSTAGDDSASGTEDEPLRTINCALGRVAPGDTVLVRGGSYHEFVRPTVSGERGRVITLAACPGETVKIDGTGLEISGLASGPGARRGRLHDLREPACVPCRQCGTQQRSGGILYLRVGTRHHAPRVQGLRHPQHVAAEQQRGLAQRPCHPGGGDGRQPSDPGSAYRRMRGLRYLFRGPASR